jgi:hypothetical protein
VNFDRTAARWGSLINPDRFEAVLRSLSAMLSRRSAVWLLAGSTFGGLLTLGPLPANAKKGKGKGKKRKKKRRGPDSQASAAAGPCRREGEDCKRSRPCCASLRCQENATGRSVCTRLTEPSNGPMPLSDPSGTWTLVFREDFDRASLDTSKWNEQYPWGGSRKACCGEEQYYTTGSRNLEFANGNLSIVARRERITAEGYTHPFSSALIQTRNRFNFTSGYFECKARMPNEYGTWPAFWTLPVDYSGSRPEWDILECYGDEPNRHSMCWHLPGAIDGCRTTYDSDVGAFRVYGFEWDSNYAIWYRDGVEMHRRSGGFNVPSYLLLNLAIHTRAGDPSLGSYPARFDVDYVYAWKRP